MLKNKPVAKKYFTTGLLYYLEILSNNSIEALAAFSI